MGGGGTLTHRENVGAGAHVLPAESGQQLTCRIWFPTQLNTPHPLPATDIQCTLALGRGGRGGEQERRLEGQ
jgi:hypothetical protein